MGIPAWVWFTVAAVAAVAGLALLAAARGQRSARNRERQRWAALRGWTFAETELSLPQQWSCGAIAVHGPAENTVARDVVTGTIFTADGRRQVHVFDLESSGRVVAVVAAVRRRQLSPTVVEFRLPSVAAPDEEAGLDLLGPVGDRFAFVSDLAQARPLITPDLVDSCDELGDDVTMVWLENAWVLAAAPANATPARLERLLRDLGELADLIDPEDTPPTTPRRDELYDVEADGGVDSSAESHSESSR